jgi:hypothetical protein
MGILQYEAYERLKEQEEDRDKKVEKVVKKKRYYTDSPKEKNQRKIIFYLKTNVKGNVQPEKRGVYIGMN